MTHQNVTSGRALGGFPADSPLGARRLFVVDSHHSCGRCSRRRRDDPKAAPRTVSAPPKYTELRQSDEGENLEEQDEEVVEEELLIAWISQWVKAVG